MIPFIIISVLAACIVGILYAIDARQKRLEERGFVEPTREGGIPFATLQKFVEPSAAHIERVREVRQHRAEWETPGEGEPPRVRVK